MTGKKKKKTKRKNSRRILYFGVGVVAFAVVAVVVVLSRNTTDDPFHKKSDAPGGAINATFVCENGGDVKVKFDGEKAYVVLPDGKSYTLEQTPSAGGGRYASRDGSTILWNTGDTVTFEENGVTLYSDCISK